jgi:hypothetical protein
MSADRTSDQPRSIRKVVVASLIGTSLEWYDFFLYGSAAALVFNKLFFPDADPLTGPLLAWNASWPQVGVPAGNLLAAGVLGIMSAALSDAAFESWGWRVPPCSVAP